MFATVFEYEIWHVVWKLSTIHFRVFGTLSNKLVLLPTSSFFSFWEVWNPIWYRPNWNLASWKWRCQITSLETLVWNVGGVKAEQTKLLTQGMKGAKQDLISCVTRTFCSQKSTIADTCSNVGPHDGVWIWHLAVYELLPWSWFSSL